MSNRTHNIPSSRQGSRSSNDKQIISKLQLALTQALDQNQILRSRVIQLEALLVAAQQFNQAHQSRSRQKASRVQPPRQAKARSEVFKRKKIARY